MSIFGGGKERTARLSICLFVRSCFGDAVQLQGGTYKSEDVLKDGMAEARGMSDINITPADTKSDD
jgi:hypothetical protein